MSQAMFNSNIYITGHLNTYNAAFSRLKSAIQQSDINNTESEQETGKHLREEFRKKIFSPAETTSCSTQESCSSDDLSDDEDLNNNNDKSSLPQPPSCINAKKIFDQ